METYYRRYAYTNHPGADHAAIEASNYDNVPEIINGIPVFIDGHYDPTGHNYGNWSVKRSGWAHHPSGLKVRYTVHKCPNYNSGTHGTMTGTLEVKYG